VRKGTEIIRENHHVNKMCFRNNEGMKTKNLAENMQGLLYMSLG
jgi:hypothetical protein